MIIMPHGHASLRPRSQAQADFWNPTGSSLETEFGAQWMAAAEKSRYWKIVNPGVLNAVGEPVAYKPVPAHANVPLISPLAMISRRMVPP